MDANNHESKKTNYLALGLCFGVAFSIIMGAALDAQSKEKEA